MVTQLDEATALIQVSVADADWYSVERGSALS
jgi:hypothetical protein